MSEGRVTVTRHVRRRTGHMVQLAKILGVEPIVKVEAYRRRRPTGHRPPKNYPGLVEANKRLQAISPSDTMRKINEYEDLMQSTGVPVDTRVLKSYIQAIALHMAGGLEWRTSLYKDALKDERLVVTDKHLLNDAVAEMRKNEEELLRRA